MHTFRGLVQTIFGKISVIVTLGGGGGGGGGGGCDVKKKFIVRKYCFIIRNIFLAAALTPVAAVTSIQTTLHIE